MTPEEFSDRFPILYHAAWPQARERIRRDGLMSPLAICEDLGFSAAETEKVLTTRRPRITAFRHDVILNDNSPLQDGPLRRALPPELSPEDWMRALNSRVFLFTKLREAEAFADAAASRSRARDLWAFDTATLADRYFDRLEITPFNTGATTRRPPARDLSTFAKVAETDFEEWRTRRIRTGIKTGKDNVREVCIYHSAPGVSGRLL